jgi:hypothetical protein
MRRFVKLSQEGGGRQAGLAVYWRVLSVIWPRHNAVAVQRFGYWLCLHHQDTSVLITAEAVSKTPDCNCILTRLTSLHKSLRWPVTERDDQWREWNAQVPFVLKMWWFPRSRRNRTEWTFHATACLSVCLSVSHGLARLQTNGLCAHRGPRRESSCFVWMSLQNTSESKMAAYVCMSYVHSFIWSAFFKISHTSVVFAL